MSVHPFVATRFANIVRPVARCSVTGSIVFLIQLLSVSQALDTDPPEGARDSAVAIAALEKAGAQLGRDKEGFVTFVRVIKPIDEDALDGIAKLPRCQTVMLHGTQMRDDEFAHLSKATQIRKLDIQVSAITDEGLAMIAHWPHLESLAIHHSRITHLARPSITAHGNLKNLSVSNVDWRDSDLAEIAKLGELQSLGIGGTLISDEGLEHLAKLKKLESLSLRVIDNRCAEGFKHIAALSELRVLSLPEEMTDEAMKHLATGLPKLTRIHVPESKLTDEGLKCLASFANLERAWIRGHQFSDEALVAFANLKKLETLDIQSERITGSGFKHLFQVYGLRELTVCSEMSQQPLRELRNRLPNASIHPMESELETRLNLKCSGTRFGPG